MQINAQSPFADPPDFSVRWTPSESQFVIGTEADYDLVTFHGESVAARHAWVWISETGLQIECDSSCLG